MEDIKWWVLTNLSRISNQRCQSVVSLLSHQPTGIVIFADPLVKPWLKLGVVDMWSSASIAEKVQILLVLVLKTLHGLPCFCNTERCNSLIWQFILQITNKSMPFLHCKAVRLPNLWNLTKSSPIHKQINVIYL